jgi:hypothetical protein
MAQVPWSQGCQWIHDIVKFLGDVGDVLELRLNHFSLHLCVGFLFLLVHSRPLLLPPPASRRLLLTHNLLITHNSPTHTTYSHIILTHSHTQLTRTQPSHTHNLHTTYSHTTQIHTTYSQTHTTLQDYSHTHTTHTHKHTHTILSRVALGDIDLHF